jgi:hypothetical protein
MKTQIYTAMLGLVVADPLMSATAASADTMPEDQSAIMSKIDTDQDG